MSDIERQQSDGVLTIVLNRPAVLNAFTRSMLTELDDALASAADPSIRAVVITGSGRAFSAGQDLAELKANPEVSYQEVFARYIPSLLTIRRLPKPVIAAVNGIAAGGGFGLAMTCDLRVASSAASFDPAFAKAGLVADTGLTYLLPRMLGQARAFEMLALSTRVSAEEAMGLGLVNRAWSAERFEVEVAAFVAQLATGPTYAYGLMKGAMESSWTATFAEALNEEGRLQGLAGRSRDHKEGLMAFSERRKAQFTGGE